MQDLNDKITGNTLTATEWNEVPSELQNVIEKTGQALSGSDLDQLGKGVAVYAAGGDYYTDGGAANAYVLSVVGTKQKPPAYFDGMRVRFKPTNTNTGASTVNVAGLGVKNIKIRGGGDPVAGDLTSGEFAQIRYDNAAGYFILENPFGHLEIGGGNKNQLLNVYNSLSADSQMSFTNINTGDTPTDGFTVGIVSTGNAYLWQRENLPIIIGTNATERMRILADGNVNIGGTHDTNRLMVHEATSGPSFAQFTNATTGVTATDGFKIGISASEEVLIYNYENTLMKFATNSADRLFIAADGGIYTNGTTGGSQGADTVNFSEYYADGRLIYDSAAPTNYSQAAMPVIDSNFGNANGGFTVSTAIGAAWESIGPTGSGATNIYTAMDDMPTDARFIIVKFRHTITHNATGLTVSKGYARKTGYVVGTADATEVSVVAIGADGTNNYYDYANHCHIIPLDTSQRFDMYYLTSAGSDTLALWQVGWL